MRTTDLTALRRKVEAILRDGTSQWKVPRTPEEWIAQQLARLDALDDLADVLDAIADDYENALDAAGVRRKRCANPGCERWLPLASTGRPREVCDDICYAAVRRIRRAAA